MIEINLTGLATPAKAEREASNVAPPRHDRDVICACGKTWRSWGGQSHCTCGAIIDFDLGISMAATPRWVRCDDRLPGDGRVYKARDTLYQKPWLIRMNFASDKLECSCSKGVAWVDCFIQSGLEWLDEAPAREGQRESAVPAKPVSVSNTGLMGHTSGQSDSHPTPCEHPYDGMDWLVGICKGCGLTVDEIVGVDPLSPWSYAKNNQLPRALRQRRAELANIEAGRNFRALFGGCRGRVG